MKKETYYCDIDGCKNEAAHKGVIIQVIFTTEQTEGRSVKPYLSMEDVDLCADCYNRILTTGRYVYGSGAQGNNTFYFKE